MGRGVRRRKKLSLPSWLIFIVVGRLLIYLFMQFPYPKSLERFPSLKKLHDCDLCAGVWIYGLLAGLLRFELLTPLGFYYVPFLSELLVGGIISFMVHIFIIGWKAKFEVIIV